MATFATLSRLTGHTRLLGELYGSKIRSIFGPVQPFKSDPMETFFQNIYTDFNSRNIDSILANMTVDIQWANGMEGGYVYGQEGVRAYWTRQFGLMSPNVTPLEIKSENGVATIKVHQVVHDLNGALLADVVVEHIFHLQDGKIAAFHIGSK